MGLRTGLSETHPLAGAASLHYRLASAWCGDRKQSTLWHINAREDAGFGHGTQKPVDCMRRPIENNSARAGRLRAVLREAPSPWRIPKRDYSWVE